MTSTTKQSWGRKFVDKWATRGNKINTFFRSLPANNFHNKNFNNFLRGLAVTTAIVVVLMGILSSVRMYGMGATFGVGTDAASNPVFAQGSTPDSYFIKAGQPILMTPGGAPVLDAAGNPVNATALMFYPTYQPILGDLLYGSQSTLKMALVFGIASFIGTLAQCVKQFKSKHGGQFKDNNNFTNSLFVMIFAVVTVGLSSSLAVLISALILLAIETYIFAQAIIVKFNKKALA